jgi:2,3-bisphosphoglycerate-dependent phosphoglycerate mutase
LINEEESDYMEIVILRHAEPEWVKDGLSVDNPPLTQRGNMQANFLAAALHEEHFDEILVSPLVRTRQTAAPLLALKQAELDIEPWLEEIRNPIWHGTPQEKAEAAWKAQRQRASHEQWQGLDGGERVDEFVERINVGTSLFLEERGLRRADSSLPIWQSTPDFDPERKIALVCHAGTGSIAICHMLGLQPTPWEWERLVIGHATINRISTLELGDGITFGLRLLSGNDHLAPHLRTF